LLRERGIGWKLNVVKEVDLELGAEWEVPGIDGHELSPRRSGHTDADMMDIDRPREKKLRYLSCPGVMDSRISVSAASALRCGL